MRLKARVWRDTAPTRLLIFQKRPGCAFIWMAVVRTSARCTAKHEAEERLQETRPPAKYPDNNNQERNEPPYQREIYKDWAASFSLPLTLIEVIP